MKSTKVYLKAVMVIREGKRVWSGEYECSICNLRFRPDPNDAARLSQNFDEHRERKHVKETQ